MEVVFTSAAWHDGAVYGVGVGNSPLKTPCAITPSINRPFHPFSQALFRVNNLPAYGDDAATHQQQCGGRLVGGQQQD